MKKNNDFDVNSFHLGARELAIDNVRLMIPNISNIKNFINDFRKCAKKARKTHNELKELSYEKYDNFISILGNRGLGKTSIMLTTIKQIKNSEYYCYNYKGKKENKYDLISPLIVPDDMSEISDILGWIIVTLENMYETQIKYYTTTTCLLNQDNEESRLEKAVRACLIDLKTNYHHRKEDYKSIVDKKYNSNAEYIEQASMIQKQDLEIVKSFNRLIDAMIDYKIYVNKLMGYYNEPLIFFFFDDVDVTARYCESIFEDFLTFLSNPHIVTFISGDYDLFSQSVTLKMLENEKIENLDINEIYSFGKQEKKYQVLEMAKNRSEFFLKKVLPPLYRFEIQLLDNRKKSELSYLKKSNCNNDLLNKKINELIKIIHKKEDFFKIKNNIVIFPYYSVFSTNVRGFINVYIYLYRIAKRKIKENEYLNFMNEFLEIILNSKNTYRKNLKNINRYLYIKTKEDEISRSDNREIDTKNEMYYDKLRIDCEELKEVVEEKIRENYQALNNENNYIRDDYRDEIEALIMLPLLMNELHYCFFSKEYQNRYMRVKEKLKNILVNVFVKEFNKNVSMLLPDNASMEDTLLFYSFVTTRMSMSTISAINGTSSQIRTYNENNDKKYFVQLMKTVCDIYRGENGLKKEEYDKLCYNNSIISDSGTTVNRDSYERKIMKKLIAEYKEENYNWLDYLAKMIRNNLSLTNHLYPYSSFYTNHIRESFNILSNIFKENENLNNELSEIIDFLGQFKFVFNDKNIAEFYHNNSVIQNKIYHFNGEIINRFIHKIKNIKCHDLIKNSSYTSLLKGFIDTEKNFNLSQFSDYSFNNQIKMFTNIIEKYNFSKQNEQTYEKYYRFVKKIYDYYYLEINKFHSYDVVDVNNLQDNIMDNLYTFLNIDDDNLDLEQLVSDQLVQIYYNHRLDNDIQNELFVLISKLSKSKVVIDRTYQYLNDTLKELNFLLNSVDVSKELVIAQSKVLMYLSPIYVVSLYLYDLKCNRNGERGFFLNLLQVFNEELINE